MKHIKGEVKPVERQGKLSSHDLRSKISQPANRLPARMENKIGKQRERTSAKLKNLGSKASTRAHQEPVHSLN